MTENALKETVIRLAEPVVRSLGLVIWGVEILQAGRMIVRLFVDVPPEAPILKARPDGSGTQLEAISSDPASAAPASSTSPSIDQCEEISRHLALALEVEDSIPNAYVLEVSTPGLTRTFFSLAQMRPYLGDMVEAVCMRPLLLKTLRRPPRATRGAKSGAAGSRQWRKTALCLSRLLFRPRAMRNLKVCRPCACPGRPCARQAACIFSTDPANREKALGKKPEKLPEKRRAKMLPKPKTRPTDVGSSDFDAAARGGRRRP